MPHPTQRRSVEHLLHAVPEVQVLVDSFAQRCQGPQRRHEADGYYWGKKKMHTLKRQGGRPERRHRGRVRERAWPHRQHRRERRRAA